MTGGSLIRLEWPPAKTIKNFHLRPDGTGTSDFLAIVSHSRR